MDIETIEDICNEMADKMGVYGTCKAAAESKDCKECEYTCCRVGFMLVMPDRIREAVENEKKLEQAGF